MAEKKEKDKAFEGAEDWEGEEGGLVRDYTMLVERDYYAIDEAYSEKVGEERCFHYYVGVDADDPAVERTEKAACGAGWRPTNDGKGCEHPEGYTKFHQSTVLGKWFNHAVKNNGLKAAMIERHGRMPKPTEGGIWGGALIKFGREQYKGMNGEMRDRTIPVKFKGFHSDGKADSGKKKTEGKAEGSKSSTKKPKDEPAKNGAGAAAGGSSIEDQLKELAAKHDNYQDWMSRAVQLPDIGKDLAMLGKVTDQNYYNSLREQLAKA